MSSTLMLNSIADMFNNAVSAIDGFIWKGVPEALIFVGVVFLIITKGVQFRFLKRSICNLFSGKHSSTHDDVNISPLQSFMTGLASRVGTGNIAGVATAIMAGGVGSVFWMWFAAIIGMASAFAESSLAQLYKVKNNEGVFVGGPAFYIEQGLKLPAISVLFSIILAFTYGFAFNSIQSNQIANTVLAAFNVDRLYTAIVITVVTAVVIFGSIKAISKASSSLVSVMSLLYIFIGILVLAVNYDQIIPAFAHIFADAFTIKAGLGGWLGTTVMFGIKRGLFSNEAGMGSAPNIAGSASTLHPADQGFVQMIGVFFDTIIICTFTALIIITSQHYLQPDAVNLNGSALTTVSIKDSLGYWSSVVMTVIVFLFAFSSIIGNFAYSLAGLKYFTQAKWVRQIFALAVCCMVFYGSIATPEHVWNLGDVAMGVMTFINLIAILFLSRQVKLIIDDYSRQLKEGVKEPVFNSDLYPELRNKLYHKSIWSRHLDESHDSEKHK